MKFNFGMGATFGIHGFIPLIYFVFVYFKFLERNKNPDGN